MGNGWIKLHRKLLENPIFKNERYLKLWIYLLLKANHKGDKLMWNGGVLEIKEGQFVTGRKKIALDTELKQSTIEDILKYLENQHQIRQQKTNKYRLITIVNWQTYQHADTKSDIKATTKRHLADTNKKGKNEKNKDLLIENPPTPEEKAAAQKIKDELTAKFKVK